MLCAHTCVFLQNEPADSLYIVISGRVRGFFEEADVDAFVSEKSILRRHDWQFNDSDDSGSDSDTAAPATSHRPAAPSPRAVPCGEGQEKGRADAKKRRHQHEATSFEIGRGEVLGESAVLTGFDLSKLGETEDEGSASDEEPRHRKDSLAVSRRHFSAVCVRDTRLVQLSRGAFLHIVKHYPMVMMRFTQVGSRLRRAHEVLCQKITWCFFLRSS